MDKWDQLHQKQMGLMLKEEEKEDQIRSLKVLSEDIWLLNQNTQHFLEELTYEFSQHQGREIFEENFMSSQRQVFHQEEQVERLLDGLSKERKELEEKIEDLAQQKRQLLMEEENNEY